MDAEQTGVIATFYSFKGGTGRSMALANVAYLLGQELATRGQKVLTIDWDLEAPGLHRYFPRSEESESASRLGLIDYFIRLSELLDEKTAKALCAEGGFRLLDELIPLDEFILTSVADGVDLIKAGDFVSEYSDRIASFQWADLYRRCPGVYRAFREFIARKYAWCLIDSRTGLSDISGVCTMLMPEKLITVFTPNRQSLDGVIDVASAAVDYRRNSDDGRPLSVFPLPSRIVTDEHKLLRAAGEKYRRRFEDCLRSAYDLEHCDLEGYFQEVAIPHKGFYGFHELVAVRDDASAGDALSINRAYERFFRRVTQLDSPWETLSGQPDAAEQFDPNRAVQAKPVEARDQSALGSIGFSNDIFLNYAEIDDLPIEGDEGFVTRLHRDLGRRLAMLRGREVRIRQDAASLTSPRLELTRDALAKSALLLAVVSPAYANSSFALKQLEAFANRPGPNAVFCVSLAPVPRTRLPEILQNTLNYRFFEHTPEGRVSGPLLRGSPDYHARLNDLAYDIAKQLESLLQATSAPTQPGRTVFLAETTSDQAEARLQLRRELLEQGYRVVPDQPLPNNSSELKARIAQQLSDAALSVHIFGSVSGLVPEGDTRSIVALQYDLACERKTLDRVVWASVVREISSDLRSRFEGESGPRRGADFLRTTLEELKSIVLQRLTEQDSSRTRRSGGLRCIYVICSIEDRQHVMELSASLTTQGFEVVLPLVEGRAAERRSDHEESIRASDCVVVFWHSAPETWIRSVLRDLMKARASYRANWPATAIFITGPTSAPKSEFDSRLGSVFRERSEFERFLERLEGASV